MVKVASLRLGIDPTAAEAGARRFQTAAGKVTSSAKTAALGVGRMVGAMAGFAGIAGTIRTIAGFENRIAVLGKVAQASDKQLAKLTERARELGAQTRFSGEEAAEGLLQLARAGFTVDEQLAAIKDTLDLATAAELDLAEASGFVSNAIRQFSLDASEAARVADAFTVASNNANTDVRQLAEAMAYAGTIAGTLGLSVEQTASFIGVLGNAGIQASMAGTNLRGVLLKLASTTEKAETALGKMGLTYDEVNPATNDAIVVFENLRRGLESLENPLEAAGIASEIFGSRNASAAVSMAFNIEKVEELTQKQIESEAAHAEVARTLEQTLIGKFTALKSAISEVMLVSGDAGLTGALKGIIDIATETAQIIGGVEGALDRAGKAAKILAAALAGIAARFIYAGIVSLAGAVAGLAAQLSTASLAALSLRGAIFPVAGAVAYFALEMKGMAEAGAKAAASIKGVKEAVESYKGGEGTRSDLLNQILQLAERRAETGRDYIPEGILSGAGLGGIEGFDMAMARGKPMGVEGARFATSESVIKRVKEELAAIAKVGEQRADKEAQIKDAIEAQADATDRSVESNRILSELFNSRVLRAGTLLANSQNELAIAEELATNGKDAAEMLRKRIELQQQGIALDSDAAREILDSHAAMLQLRRQMAEEAANERREQEAIKRAARETANLIERAVEASKARRDRVGEGIVGLRRRTLEQEFEMQSIGLTADEYERAQRTRDIYIQQSLLMRDADADQAEEIQRLTGKLLAQADALEKLQDKRAMMLEFQDGFVDMFADIITGAESAADAFEQFANRMIAMMTEMILKKALMDAFFSASTAGTSSTDGGGSSGVILDARGSFYDGGKRFARGGIVSRPTNFLYSGGLGVMGEAGPEAIMPIGRNSKGEVGVKVAGGAQQRPNVTVNMTVNTPDADSFRKSRIQIQDDLRRMTTKTELK